jgi:Tol biopolymer transport system component
VTDAEHAADGVDLSPDGGRIAYTLRSAGSEKSELWISDLNTGRSERLASDNQRRLYPQWSPDGRHLAYLWDNGPNQSIAVWNLDAGDEQFVIPPQKEDTFVSGWSPDGRSVLANTPLATPPVVSLVLFPFAAAVGKGHPTVTLILACGRPATHRMDAGSFSMP